MLQVMRKLFVGNMNVTSTKESVTEYFEQVLWTLWNTYEYFGEYFKLLAPSSIFLTSPLCSLESLRMCTAPQGRVMLSWPSRTQVGLMRCREQGSFPSSWPFFYQVKKIRPHKVDDRLVDTKRSTPKEFAGIPDMDCRFLLVSDLVPVLT